jgi:hypothetical protein
MNSAKVIFRRSIRQEASVEAGLLTTHPARQELDGARGRHGGDRAAAATSVTSRGDPPRA